MRQARSDLEVFEVLKGQPLCQRLHYLQMASEKLAKAFLPSLKSSARPARVHSVFVKFLRTSKSFRQIRSASGIRDDRQFRAYIAGLLSTAHELENLAPVGDVDKPNPEYPWESSGQVISPLDYPFGSLQLADPKMVRLLKFIDMCLKIE